MATGKMNVSAFSANIGHDFITTPAGLEALFNAVLYDVNTPEEVLLAVTLDDYASGLSILIPWYMKSANSGNVVIYASVMKIEDGDAVETANFDTANSTGAIAVPGTVKDQKFTTLVLSNDGSPLGAEVTFLILLKRKADDGGDTASGNMAIGPGPIIFFWTTT